MKHILQFALQLKRLLIFIASIGIVFAVYRILLPEVWQRDNVLITIIVLWFFTAYIVLPRIHRFLSRFYVPDHFIARVRTVDGLLSDPINVAFNGERSELIAGMEAAGWQLADKLSAKSIWKTVLANTLKRSYPNAPVSEAFLFGRRQSLAFQKEVDDNPHQRHHVRFWHTPRNWYMPGGYRVDWLGSASYDRAVSFSFFTSQFTHKIDARVDREREYLITSLEDVSAVKHVQRIDHFFPSYRSRNGFGHYFFTDGSIVIANLKQPKT